jgi:hypothetical protein
MRQLRAVFSSFALHVGLTIFLAMLLVAVGVTQSLPSILIPYIFLGWIPVAVWVYPILRDRMK